MSEATPDSDHHSRRATILVLNSHVETLEMLAVAIRTAGFNVATGVISDYRTGREDLFALLAQVQPDVIVYDLAIPYEENWAFLRRVQSNPAFPACGVVLTSTNERAVRTLLGVSAIELFGKPYDLAQLVEAVSRAAAGEPILRSPVNPDDRRVGDRRTGSQRRGSRNSPEQSTD